jgi:hypothetical protein
VASGVGTFYVSFLWYHSFPGGSGLSLVPIPCWNQGSPGLHEYPLTEGHPEQPSIHGCLVRLRSSLGFLTSLAKPPVSSRKTPANSASLLFSICIILRHSPPPPRRDHGGEVLVCVDEDGRTPHPTSSPSMSRQRTLCSQLHVVHRKFLMLNEVLILRKFLKSCLCCVRLCRLSPALAKLPT